MKQAFLLLFNNTLSASIVILVALVARMFLSKVSRRYSYWLWLVVGIRLLFPFSFTSPVTVLKAVDAPSMQLGELPLSTVAYVPIVSESASVAMEEGSATHMFDFVGLASVAWLVGLAVLLGYMLYSYVSVKHLVSTAIRLQGNVYESENVGSPFILGLVKPRIYLPLHLEEREKEYILAHEGYHIHCGDHIAKAIAYLITCVYWYNPLVWLSFALMQRDMEMRCDEHVLSLDKGMKKEYGTLLLRLAEERGSLLSPLSFGENDIKARIKNILAYRKPKRIVAWACVVAVILLTIACMGNPEIDTGMPEPVSVVETLSPSVTEKPDPITQANPMLSVSWQMEPSLELEGVKELGNYAHVKEVNGYDGIFLANMTGYCQNWQGEYDPDTISIRINGKEGIYDYDGNVVYPVALPVLDPYRVGICNAYDLNEHIFRFGTMNEPSIGGKGYVFSNDFKNITEAEIFIDYYDADGPRDVFGVKDGVFGIAHLRTNEPWFEPYNYKGIAIAVEYDNVIENNSYTYVVVENGRVIQEVIPEYNGGSLINGFYTVSQWHDDRAWRGLVEAKTATQITPLIYSQIKWFQEGLCPVNYNGKWGYVKEDGSPVTEYLFDDASVVYDGKAYVAIDGYYGIIDFQDTFDRGIDITYDTCTSGWEFSERLFQITVVTDALNIRNSPTGDIIAVTYAGNRHNVYEIVKHDDYTWYRIGKNRWIADDGSWIRKID